MWPLGRASRVRPQERDLDVEIVTESVKSDGLRGSVARDASSVSGGNGVVQKSSRAKIGRGQDATADVHTVTKKDLIDRISERTHIKRQDVKVAVQEFLDQVVSELQAGNRLEFRDFGVFEIKFRAPRVAQNPKTLARVDVPAKRTVKFKVGRLMRESLEKLDEMAHGHSNGTLNGTLNGSHGSVTVMPGLKPKANG